MTDFSADPVQPKVEFAFGEQPKFTRNTDVGKKIGVIGAGDVWIKFILPQLAQRGGDLYIIDPKRADIYEKAEAAGVPPGKIHVTENIAGLPKDLHGVWVLTPPNTHLPIIQQIYETIGALPIALEKPVVGNREDMTKLDVYVSKHKLPVYGVDWMLLNAQPLYLAAGLPQPIPGAVKVANADAFRKFDFSNIASIRGFDIEGGGNSLGDPTVLAKSRPWMMDYRQGGGVAYDMTVHLANTLAAMGFKANKVNEAYLGTHTAEPGVYNRFGLETGDQKTGDIYSRVHMTMDRGDNKNIPTVLESGKNAAYNDQFIELKDKMTGNILHWEIIPSDSEGRRIPGSIAQLRTPEGQTLATASMRSDAYALTAEHFDRYATQYRTGQRPPKETSFFSEHKEGILMIAAMHDTARSVTVREGEKVTQISLHPGAPNRVNHGFIQHLDAK